MKANEIKSTILQTLKTLYKEWDYSGNTQVILNNEIIRVWETIISAAHSYTTTDDETPMKVAEYAAVQIGTYIASIYSDITMSDAIANVRAIDSAINRAIADHIINVQQDEAFVGMNDDETAVHAFNRAIADCYVSRITDDVCESGRGGYMRGGYALQTKKRVEIDGKKRVEWVNIALAPLPAVRGRIIVSKLLGENEETAPSLFKPATAADLKSGHYRTTKSGAKLHATRNGDTVSLLMSPQKYGNEYVKPIADAYVFLALDMGWIPTANRRDYRVMYLPTLTVC